MKYEKIILLLKRQLVGGEHMASKNISMAVIRRLPKYYRYLGDLLEISSGISHIISSNNLFLICLLVYSNGLCMLLQTIQVSTFIKPSTFCLYRLLYLILASSITLFIHFCFYC